MRRVLAIGAALTLLAGAASAETDVDRAIALAEQARAAAGKGDFKAAVATGRRALERARRITGLDPTILAAIQVDLANSLRETCALGEARRVADDALGLLERSGLKGQQDWALIAGNLANVMRARGELLPAEELTRTAREALIRIEGPGGTNVLATTRNLADTLLEAERWAEAEAEARAALARSLTTVAADPASFVDDGERLARLLVLQGRLAEAEAPIAAARARLPAMTDRTRRAELAAILDLAEANMLVERGELPAGERLARAVVDRPDLRRSTARLRGLYTVARIQLLKRDMLSAERSLRETLDGYRAKICPDSPATVQVLHALALAYDSLGQKEDSRQLMDEVIALRRKAGGERGLPVASSLNESVRTLVDLGQAELGLARAREARSIYEELGDPQALWRAFTFVAEGFALRALGRSAEAVRAFTIGTDRIRAIAGPSSSDLWPGLLDLAELSVAAGEFDRATTVLAEAVAILAKDGSATVDALGRARRIEALSWRARDAPTEALAAIGAATRILRDRLPIAQTTLSAAAFGEQRAGREIVLTHLDIGLDLGVSEAELIEIAQLPQLTGTAATVVRMAARLGAGDGALATLLRERQDAVEAWQALDELLLRRSGPESLVMRERQVELEARIADLDSRLTRDFPAFADLTRPKPVPLTELQGLMGPKEALFWHLTGPRGSFLVLVRRDRAMVTRSDLDAPTLERSVTILRDQLTPERVFAFEQSFPDRAQPFDAASAHRLYRGLLGPLGDALVDIDHLVVVPDGAMQSIPPAVLLTEPRIDLAATKADLAGYPFLAKKHAISIVPSAAAFKSLRAVIEPSRAPEPFLGVGNPDFKGPSGTNRGIDPNRTMARGGDVSLKELRALPQLPQTEPELKAIAATLAVGRPNLVLGLEASETKVRKLPLSRYKVLAFATHGFVSGELTGLAEPALALSPPGKITAQDDGLLTASEITGLTLDADWVLLSACNTASSSGKPGAEGLSGLARAFFYAGSRALLVSHWSVETESAQALTTGTMTAFVSNGRRGRSDALRTSQLTLMARPEFAHPYYWSPFVVVGEGR